MPIKTDLAVLAQEVMIEKGLEPEFSKAVEDQLAKIDSPASRSGKHEDLRSLLFCSIDNDDSRDLDQLTYAEKSSDGKITMWIAIADVDALVGKDTPVDQHARKNTTSVYTPARIFSMLPEKLSTNLTSMNENVDRICVVTKIQIDQTGNIESSSIFQGIAHNYAKLTYNGIGGWLEGKNPLPDKAKDVPELENVLKIQHEIAQILRKKRQSEGSLTLESTKTEVKIEDQDHIDIQLPPHNLAHQLIEEFMIAANRTMVRHCRESDVPSLRRIVRIPKYWDRIVEVAKTYGENLPEMPDSKALDAFLVRRQKADPVSFPDLSLVIIKLLGRGEYIVENDKNAPTGHFALAVSDYTHATAPNRRFPDLITQRQYKSFLQGKTGPYALEELRSLAEHCTKQEDAATKVERHLNKSASALLLSKKIGSFFKGIITGSNENGTWVRVFEPAVEGKVSGAQNLGVGDRVRVQLKSVNIEKGFIDFVIAD